MKRRESSEQLCGRIRAYIGEIADHTRDMKSVLKKEELHASYSVPYIYGVYISFMEGIHMAIWQKPIGKQREKNKFGKSEKFLP